MGLAPDQILPERIRPLRRVEYERLVELGLFDDERVELLQGAIVEMSPQGSAHAFVSAAFFKVFAPLLLAERVELRSHSPLALSGDSAPEPDVALVPPGSRPDAHPTTAFLVVEVADSSLRKDRGVKASLYAAAAIPEYWLVNLRDSVVEVHTEPHGDRYLRVTPYRTGDTIRVVALADVVVDVADFLPTEA